MQSINIRAHYDGTSIQLDESVELPTNIPLLLTVLPANETDAIQCEWAGLAAQGLSAAYGDDEPTYSDQDVLS